MAQNKPVPAHLWHRIENSLKPLYFLTIYYWHRLSQVNRQVIYMHTHKKHKRRRGVLRVQSRAKSVRSM